MMLSLEYPEILSHIKTLVYGYQPLRLPGGDYSLILKANKELILTARINHSFKIYFPADENALGRAHGIISAFFDDPDEPLAMFTPLHADDNLLRDLGTALSQDRFNLYFFDEHDRELMGVSARIADVERFRKTLSTLSFPDFDEEALHETYAAMDNWYGQRDTDQDALAFEVCLDERLYPDDLTIVDFRNIKFVVGDLDAATDDPKVLEHRINPTSLERKEPGAFQERDIAALLRRCFSGDEILVNPVREDTGKELCDVLVVSEDILLLVQAKDSPNTEASLRRTITRKKSVIRDHIVLAAGQLRGAIKHVLGRDKIVLRTPSGPKDIEVGDRCIFGLVVVREMFDDDFPACSAPVLAVAEELEQLCLLIDYAALHTMAHHLPSKDRFLNGFIQMLEVALEKREFPKPRFMGRPPEPASDQ